MSYSERAAVYAITKTKVEKKKDNLATAKQLLADHMKIHEMETAK